MTTDPKEVLRIHSQTFRSFGGHTLASFEGSPSPLAFAKLVAENRPALFRNSNVEDWPAMESFGNRSQLVDLIGSDRNVKVAVTPNGLADAVIDGTFVLPHEESLSINEFFDRLDAEDPSNPQAVHYIQSQNNNMRGDGDFAKLFEQVPEHIDFATEALGAMPDAVNFWCGSRHAVTSFHKDHYENIYIVITGSKTFTLIPPSESWALEERTFPTSKYTPTETRSWTQEVVYMDPKTYDTTTDASQSHPRMMTRWCSLDPTRDEDLETFTDRIGFTAYKSPFLTVTLERGDMLYLPALWAHKVEQGSGTIAVNYWYDFSFGGSLYLLHRMLRGLAADAGYMERDEDIDGDDDDDDCEEEDVDVDEETLLVQAGYTNHTIFRG